MDLFIIGAIALLTAAIGALAAIITRRPLLRILTYTVIGLGLGIPIGYALAPFILSFY